jgi:hypothetical protein
MELSVMMEMSHICPASYASRHGCVATESVKCD